MRNSNLNTPRDAVLIVDDDPGVAAYMADLVESFFDVKALRAETANSARDLFAKYGQEIRAALCDFTLGGGVSGTTLVKEFCAARSDLGIIFVTGHLLDEEKLSRVVGREVRLIMKPFGPAELKEAIEKFLPAPELLACL